MTEFTWLFLGQNQVKTNSRGFTEELYEIDIICGK